MKMEFETLVIDEPEKGILSVTLNRPMHLNAINMEMLDDLYCFTSQIRMNKNEYKAIILKGAGKAFCSGGDLKSFEAIYHNGKDEIENFISKFLRFSKVWYELPIPTIAHLHGPVMGGGASLALASDIRIASNHTKIQFVFSRIGLIPDMGAHYFLPKIVGEAKALELLYFGNPIDATEAYRIGLVHQVVEEQIIDKEVLRFTSQFKQTTHHSNQIIKQLVKRSSERSLDQILNDETYYQTECFKSKEFQGFIKGFFHK